MLRVLVLDDDSLVLRAIDRELREQFEVVTTSTVSAALTRVEVEDFDAVVSDYFLGPGYNGLWLLQAIRSRTPHTARILISGNIDDHVIRASLDEGVIDEFIAKPWARGRLAAAVARATRAARKRTTG